MHLPDNIVLAISMKVISICILSLICIHLYACSNNIEREPVNNSNGSTNTDTMKLKVTIGSSVFFGTLQDNSTTAAFKAMLPMTLNMVELNRNEKYVDLSRDLPTNASNPGTIKTGDLMLYGSNTLVLFYKTFSTSYSYTKLGRIDDVKGLANAVGLGNVTVIFELE